MSIPDFQAFMLPFLQALADGQEHSLQEQYQILAEQAQLSDAQRQQKLPSGKQLVFHNRIGWARTHLKKAGLLMSPSRGRFVITERGQDVLAQQLEAINTEFLEQFPEYLEFKNSGSSLDSKSGEQAASRTPTEQLEYISQQLQSELTEELLSTIKQASPVFFETLVVDLMIAMGYGGSRQEAGRATQYSADGGIDGIIKEDPLGLENIYLQAKRYNDKTVGRPEVQAFAGALDMQRAKKGVFITTSQFSRDAVEFANLIEKRIVLIDGEKLASLMIDYQLGVSTKQRFEIKQIDSDYFAEDE